MEVLPATLSSQAWEGTELVQVLGYLFPQVFEGARCSLYSALGSEIARGFMAIIPIPGAHNFLTFWSSSSQILGQSRQRRRASGGQTWDTQTQVWIGTGGPT